LPKKAIIKTAKKFRLEDHLLLARFIASKLGMKKVADTKEFKDVKEGFDSDGRSYMYHAIVVRSGNTISEEKLREYDNNIRKYVEKLKKNREQNISLKYYQYLALLFSEIYLDSYFQDPVAFVNELNEWASNVTLGDAFSAQGLKKIAYWMATGSGKTWIMHVNYWQFMTYNRGANKLDFDNVILITPSEGMTKQHLDELVASGIQARMFHGESRGYFGTESDETVVKVIEIHKLKLPEDKKGEGVTVDVSSLGTKNLVFVDEGHKGQRSEDRKWKQVRDRLGKNGFTFEYSATFGQAIANSSEESFLEYSKAILFDYSYKYFHGDGYGKDFCVLNLDCKRFDESRAPILLLANAMSFYEQLLVYKGAGESLEGYNIEKPLWVFVGSRVNEDESDVLEVVRFLNWLLVEKEKDVKSWIKKILEGKSGLLDPDKRDVFAPRYPETNFVHLRQEKLSPDEIYDGIFKEIFHISSGATGRKLHLVNIKNADGEIGLRAGTSESHFGVINIGNKSDFLKLVEEKAKDISIENDVTTPSLFEKIDDSQSPLNILIGAKKFIEGWNSWRVSNMGLLNIGKSEGPQIIQLFGRGVRLKGKDYALKRSSFLPPPHPRYVEVLETLNIFGIRANYMEVFRGTVEKEDVLVYRELTLKTKLIEPFPEGLQILRLPEEQSFTKELLMLEPEDGVGARVDLLPRVAIIDSRAPQLMPSATQSVPKVLRKEILDLVDWDEILFAILNYKKEREWFNVAISKDVIKEIMYQQKYSLLCLDEVIEPSSFESVERVKDIVTLVLKRYFDRYYSKKRNAWEKKKLELKPLRKSDEGLLKEYKVRLSEEDEKLLADFEQAKSSGTLYNPQGGKNLSNAYFRGHLYQPLLVKRAGDDRVITIPTGLNEGETKFVEDLAKFFDTNPRSLQGVDIYLLRNLTGGRGVGFFETNTFYPDFIMWIKQAEKQRIVFIDPKGLIFIGDLDHPKLKLHEYLRNEVQNELKNPNVKLDAFIVSHTPYESVNKRYPQYAMTHKDYEENMHILFQYAREGRPDQAYVERMFEITCRG